MDFLLRLFGYLPVFRRDVDKTKVEGRSKEKMEPGQSMLLLQATRNGIMAARDKLKASEDSHKQTKIELRQSVEEGTKQQKEIDGLKGQLAQANGKSQTSTNRVAELEDQLARARKLIVAADDELKNEKKLKMELLRT